jgi:hypothetical protein
MILETIICLGVLFFIAVLFYKQANEQFEILQLDADRFDELPTLYADHSPIVVKNVSVPQLGTHAELYKRPHIYNMAVAPNLSLKALLSDEARLSTFQFSKLTAEFLATETGLPIWVEKHLRSFILPSHFTSWFYTTKTSLWPHHRGLFKTTAFQTILLPTQGKANISLLLESQEAYLPKVWKGRAFHSLTPQDTPLLNQIKFMEVLLRKGHMLVLPAHMIVDIQPSYAEEENDAWTMIVELHHPISLLASLR